MNTCVALWVLAQCTAQCKEIQRPSQGWEYVAIAVNSIHSNNHVHDHIPINKELMTNLYQFIVCLLKDESKKEEALLQLQSPQNTFQKARADSLN